LPQRPKAVAKQIQENPRVVITEWRLAPSAETGWHRHAHDYVVVCLTSGQLTAESGEGTSVTKLELGQTYARPAGVEHNIVNSGSSEFAFIEIELK
jgi:beta-alanine degradation protein BauB